MNWTIGKLRYDKPAISIWSGPNVVCEVIVAGYDQSDSLHARKPRSQAAAIKAAKEIAKRICDAVNATAEVDEREMVVIETGGEA